MADSKWKTLEELAAITERAKREKKKVVHCHGVFDLLHIGHIRHFRQARKMGDLLVVTLTPDKHVNKGPTRPAFHEDVRAEAVASLDMVDYVALNCGPTAIEAIRLLKPDFYVKGADYKEADKDRTGGIVLEREAVESVGGRVAFTDDIVFSSSYLVNRYASVLPKEVNEYLESFASRHGTDEVVGYLENARSLRALVVGETIIDEYQYCEAIGKSSKEPSLAVRDLYTARFAGGVAAVANHVAEFCGRVEMATVLGRENPREEFLASKLNPRIQPRFLYRKGAPTIVKKRLIERYFFTRMLEIYSINDAALEPDADDALCRALEQALPDHDLVVVADYGHGMLSPRAAEILSRGARFLALSAQANAGNMGYNLVSKYPRADYIVLGEEEAHLEARTRRKDLKEVVREIARRLDCPRVVITQGGAGALCYDRESGFCNSPALASRVVDRVGASDAFLSVSALCAVQKAPMEVVGFVGNAAGAFAVSVVCNERPVERVALLKQIETLLK